MSEGFEMHPADLDVVERTQGRLNKGGVLHRIKASHSAVAPVASGTHGQCHPACPARHRLPHLMLSLSEAPSSSSLICSAENMSYLLSWRCKSRQREMQATECSTAYTAPASHAAISCLSAEAYHPFNVAPFSVIARFGAVG